MKNVGLKYLLIKHPRDLNAWISNDRPVAGHDLSPHGSVLNGFIAWSLRWKYLFRKQKDAYVNIKIELYTTIYTRKKGSKVLWRYKFGHAIQSPCLLLIPFWSTEKNKILVSLCFVLQKIEIFLIPEPDSKTSIQPDSLLRPFCNGT